MIIINFESVKTKEKMMKQNPQKTERVLKERRLDVNKLLKKHFQKKDKAQEK